MLAWIAVAGIFAACAAVVVVLSIFAKVDDDYTDDGN